MPTAFVPVHLDFKLVFICISFECKQIKYDKKWFSFMLNILS